MSPTEGIRHRDVWRNLLFIVAVPGTVAGLIPWLITRWDLKPWGPWECLIVPVAIALLLVGGSLLFHAIWFFARQGRGTPSPTAPTEQLVVGGVFRYVRNPMYLGVSAVIAAQCLLSPSPGIVLWLIFFVTATTVFVKVYEEPTLHAAYGPEYTRYREEVPGWFPRRSAWEPNDDSGQ
jgi:protein-S-isoprenylcysteine O-methyltransferase Ste14